MPPEDARKGQGEDVAPGRLVTQWGRLQIKYLRAETVENDSNTVRLQLAAVNGVNDFYNPDKHLTVIRVPESGSEIGEKYWHPGLDSVEAPSQDYQISPFDRQLQLIVQLTEKNRYDEAREIFKQLDLKPIMHKARLASFLEYLNQPEVTSSVHPQMPPEDLKFLCERQELLLDMSEGTLGDRQLTAKFLQQFARMIAIRSNQSKFQKFSKAGEEEPRGRTGSSIRASVLYSWLKEELDLLPTLPDPAQRIQKVILCLRDPCERGEHRRLDLSDTLKTYRLWKSSIDIFSELFHSWSTQGTASEVEWLILLESQKSIQDSVVSFLFEISGQCNEMRGMLERTGDLVGGNHSNLLATLRAVITAFITSALVWVERGRARTLLTQLGPWYSMGSEGGNSGCLKAELTKFYKDEEVAFSSIPSSTSACKAKTLFIEYVMTKELSGQTYVDTVPKAFITTEQSQGIAGVYVFDSSCAADGRPFPEQVQDQVTKFYKMVGDFCKKNPLPRRLEDCAVQRLHDILEKLYDLLIEPFSNNSLFKQLDPKATIVFVPDKMLYKVPFALLRDRRTQKYLFQLHPIAISTSLRVLQHCEQQLGELEKFPLKPGGCILAVGNAAYEKRLLLPGTREELEFLRSSIPGRVKTLEKEEATLAQFLDLVQEASRSEKQHVFAFIHLAVHGHWSESHPGEDKLHKTGSLQFAKLSAGLSSRDRPGAPQSRAAEQEEEVKSELGMQGPSVRWCRHKEPGWVQIIRSRRHASIRRYHPWWPRWWLPVADAPSGPECVQFSTRTGLQRR